MVEYTSKSVQRFQDCEVKLGPNFSQMLYNSWKFSNLQSFFQVWFFPCVFFATILKNIILYVTMLIKYKQTKQFAPFTLLATIW